MIQTQKYPKSPVVGIPNQSRNMLDVFQITNLPKELHDSAR